jgi:ribosome-binding protein aMBF1 (putative translation factor)
MKKTMKNIKKSTSRINIDPIFEARKNSNFEKYAQEAEMKVRIAEEVFTAREKMRLSQNDLAKIVGTTQRIISSMENGDLNPGSFLLFRVGKALNFNSHNLARIHNCSESFVVMNAFAGTIETYTSKDLIGLNFNK